MTKQTTPRMGATGADVNKFLRRNAAGAMGHRTDRKRKTRAARKRAALKEQGY